MATPTLQIPDSSPAITSRETRSRAGQVALVYGLLPSGILATLGVSTLLAWGLAGHIPGIWLYTWLGSVLLVSSVRLLNLRAWRRSAAPADRRWTQYFYLGTAAAGLTWGLAGFLLFPADSGGQMLMTFALAGIAAGGMSTLGIFPPHMRFFCWLLCCLLAYGCLCSMSIAIP